MLPSREEVVKSGGIAKPGGSDRSFQGSRQAGEMSTRQVQ